MVEVGDGDAVWVGEGRGVLVGVRLGAVVRVGEVVIVGGTGVWDAVGVACTIDRTFRQAGRNIAGKTMAATIQAAFL